MHDHALERDVDDRVPGIWAVRPSRSRTALLAIAALTGLAALLLLETGTHPLVTAAGVVLLVAATPRFLRDLVDRRPRLVIDDQGVFDRSLGIGPIPWSEIEGAEIRFYSRQRFVSLRLRDPAWYTARAGPVRRVLRTANRRLGWPDLVLNLVGLPVRPDDVLARIRAELAARRPR